MKTLIRLSILILILSLSASSCQENSKKNQVKEQPESEMNQNEKVLDSFMATIRVNTKDITVDYKTIRNIDDLRDAGATFSFLKGDSIEIVNYDEIKNDVISIPKNKKLKWIGESDKENEIVHIELIQYIDGTNPFKNEEVNLPGVKDSSAKGRTVTAKFDQETGDTNCIYGIVFRIEYEDGTFSQNYIIDPEIEVRGDM